MALADLLIGIFLLAAAAWSYLAKKLTLAGAITGFAVGLLSYKGAGFTGLAMLTLFFSAGSWATGWQTKSKAEMNANEKRTGGRTAGQVLANGGMAALLGAAAWYMPAYAILLHLMMAGSLASAAADTLSSELGTVYGRRFYNVLSFKKDTKGLDGVISLEGTLIGVAGAILIAIVYAIGFGWGINIFWIILAGFIGNLTDSVLGATLERKGIIGNNMVNFLNTVTGALVCYLLML
ncbi:DUF92 domain-containing protein [Mucilaginibacter mali]|uniref:DUF92 domain-containing protein n=1 Tax=Mucilaginibacter mali TaxID=2740462 RepID=A0A7D4UC88_9SPHI|nr:DUF92 domain-containing protein [Mucilaginibacter mali]QKJ29059.1 DUF92 domain-containing protein [Mucilaginibacter mali]